jgi:uncharacterized membrane protein HdeD (DUF308 family)
VSARCLDFPNYCSATSEQVNVSQPGGDIVMVRSAATGRESHQWGIVLLQGIALFVLGLLLVISPEIATVILVACLGIYWLTSGILAIVRLVSGDRSSHWLRPLVAGILGIVAGLAVIQNPRFIAAITPLGIVVILAAVAMFWGALDVIEGVRGGEWMLLVTGSVDIVIGLLLLEYPVRIAAALPFWLGILGMVGAVALISIACWMRGAVKAKEKR